VEAAKKNQQGKLPLPMDLSAWLKAAVPPHVHVLPLTADIIVESTRLPEFPVNDPADQLIVATARVHKLMLLTTDTKLKATATRASTTSRRSWKKENDERAEGI